ncbi:MULTISPECIES: hypothetical protein [Streptosporangium]|uniref:Uncharacterized protein n=1 Tax=Streptosporangium brasiliense TaxID=47480 RepID=A0ABT9RH33_9ACTN|nr:hypothetical protein [Streptosporangium brasiliense]MDP9868161.1 hypothetical protein [Streptosporangium brasiliense]
MGEIKRIKSVSESGELRLLTVVSARKDAGSSLSRVRSIAKTIGRSPRAYDDRAIENADRFR